MPVLQVEISVNKESYTVVNTHLTVTLKRSTTNYQQEQVQKLLEYVKSCDKSIICGDFNVPRGCEIFNLFATKYADNIPKECTTTLDQNLHRVPGIQFVVDVLFTSKSYCVKMLL